MCFPDLPASLLVRNLRPPVFFFSTGKGLVAEFVRSLPMGADNTLTLTLNAVGQRRGKDTFISCHLRCPAADRTKEHSLAIHVKTD